MRQSLDNLLEFDDLTLIGHRITWDGEQLFGLDRRALRQHTAVFGQTGTGKSTLLRNLVLQHIHFGQGVGLIDPHGDTALEILDHIPPSRFDDVIFFDPGNAEYPCGVNLLSVNQAQDRHRIASGIVSVFKSVWRDSFGPRMEHILNAALMALLECRNVSLLALPRILVDSDFRGWVLRQVKDPVVRTFWLKEFASYDLRFQREATAPILNKVGQLLLGPTRNILGQVANRLDFREIIDGRKIFIANLSKGRLGEDKTNLLGALLLTQFQQAAFSRADIPEAKRVDFNLIVDEFGAFSTDTFASLLSEARKYHLGLTLAGQYLDQAKEEVVKAVLGNVGNIISFRVSEQDATVLSRHFGGHYDPSLFSSLDNFQIVAKVLRGDRYGDPFLAKTLPALEMPYNRSENLIRHCRERYATPRHVVEKKIERWVNRPYA